MSFNSNKTVPDALRGIVESLHSQICDEDLKCAVGDFLDGGEEYPWREYKASPSDTEKANQITSIVYYCQEYEEYSKDSTDLHLIKKLLQS